MRLTLKMENFCLAYIANGGIASDAYRSAYNSENMNSNVIRQRAFDLMNNPKIIARLDELRAPVTKAAQISLANHLSDLLDIRDKALAAGNFSAAVAAEVARGKASGLYVERTESNVTFTIGLADRAKAARERVINEIPLARLENHVATAH